MNLDSYAVMQTTGVRGVLMGSVAVR